MSDVFIAEFYKNRDTNQWSSPETTKEKIYFKRDDGSSDCLSENEVRQIMNAYRKKWRLK